MERFIYYNSKKYGFSARRGEKINKYRRDYNILSEILGRTPNDFELAAYMGVSIVDLKKIRGMNQEIISLDEYVSPDKDDDDTLINFIPDSYNIEDGIINNSLREVLLKLVHSSILSEREKNVLLYRNGFYGRVYTLEEIGRMFSLTRERIRQIEEKSYKKLILRYKKDLMQLVDYTSNPDKSRKILNTGIKDKELEMFEAKECNVYYAMSKRGHSKEDIDLALSMISKDKLNIYKKIVGDISLEIRTDISLSINNKNQIKSFYYNLEQIIFSIEEERGKALIEQYDIYEVFNIYEILGGRGYSESEVDNALNKLTSKQKYELYSRCGTDLKNPVKVRKISVSQRENFNTVIRRLMLIIDDERIKSYYEEVVYTEEYKIMLENYGEIVANVMCLKDKFSVSEISKFFSLEKEIINEVLNNNEDYIKKLLME